MKIILLHYAAPPVVGGVETVIARHARLMADDGHDVCIIAGRGDRTDPRVEFTRLPEVDSRHPEVMKLKSSLDGGLVPAEFEPFAERLAAQLEPHIRDADRLIAHNVCSLHKNLALTVALHQLSQQGTSPHFILWHHDLAWTTPRYRSELHHGYPWDLLRTDWPWAAQVAVSAQRQVELAELLHVAATRIHVVPNGVDAREFLKLEDETNDLRRRLQLDEAAPLVLLPARITPRKNIELALRVLAALREQFPRARLMVTGPLGPHNPANRQYFEHLVALRSELGLQTAATFLADTVDHAISDAVVADLYRLADLLLLPSREEGFGIPVLEAGLAGIPVFCSDIHALRELGGEDVHYFSPNAEPKLVAKAIASVLQASKLFALRKRALQRYTWEGIYQDGIAPLLAEGTR